MIISEAKLKQIREAVQRGYHTLLVQLLDRKDLSKDVLAQLKRLGIEPKDTRSFLARVYTHTFLNDHGRGPKSATEMASQQAQRKPAASAASRTSVEQLNQGLAGLLEKQVSDMTNRIDGMLRDQNHRAKFDHQLRPIPDLEQHFRTKTMHQIRRRLQEVSEDGNRNWDRVVHTEVSNAVGLGSADRILQQNEARSPQEIYVYRIITPDESTCRWCKRFYLDGDGSPKVYRLSQLLANGSNYGKKAAEWLPGVSATHPNERCSAIIQLPEGWKVLAGGQQTFIGHRGWDLYIQEKVSV